MAAPPTPTLALAAGLLAALAGCAGDGPAAAEAAAPAEGTLHGVVVDDAIRPVARAEVALLGTGLSTTTAEDGTFGFAGLAPGSYTVEARKTGLLPAQTQVSVSAGVAEPPFVKLQLPFDTTGRLPYVVAYVFDGFIDASGGVGFGPESGLYVGAGSAYEYVLDAYPTWVQDEMVWQSTQAATPWLNHNFYYPDPGEQDLNMDQRASGPSPLLNTMNASVSRAFAEGLDYKGGDLLLRGRMFTVATDEVGPALTLQQAFRVYTHVFYGFEPPAGWRFTEGGLVPEPPLLTGVPG